MIGARWPRLAPHPRAEDPLTSSVLGGGKAVNLLRAKVKREGIVRVIIEKDFQRVLAPLGGPRAARDNYLAGGAELRNRRFMDGRDEQAEGAGVQCEVETAAPSIFTLEVVGRGDLRPVIFNSQDVHGLFSLRERILHPLLKAIIVATFQPAVSAPIASNRFPAFDEAFVEQLREFLLQQRLRFRARWPVRLVSLPLSTLLERTPDLFAT